MSLYQDLVIDTDPDSFVQEAYDYLIANVPGFDPNAGNLETILIQALARIVAELREVAVDIPSSIFRYFGSSIANITPIDATSATATSTWTLTDTLGHTIPAGTTVGITDSAGNIQPFQTLSDVVVAPGASVTTAGQVVLIAVNPGADASGLTGVPQLLDPLAWVTSIALVGATSGGVSAEDDDTYLNRLRTQLQLSAPRPILPADFTGFARQITGVQRALAVDGYNPNTLTYSNARTISVACIDSAGAAVSAPIKANVLADLQARREANFLVFVIDPTTTALDVTITGKASPGFDLPTIQANVSAAIVAFLSPANWGQPRYGDTRDWNQLSTVRYLELAEAINRVEGFDYITALTFGVHLGAMGTADLVLPGVAPLPTSVGGTISVTVS